MNKDIAYIIALYLPDSKTRCAYAQVSTQTYKATKLLPNVLSNGKRHGIYKQSRRNRISDSITIKKSWSECTYKDDKRHGLYKTYYKSGELHYEDNYKDDKRHGLYKEYHKSGELSYEVNYKDGIVQ